MIACVAVVALGTACQKQGAPEQVADGFVEAYFVRADQERAKDFTALGATEMLEKELKDVAAVRKDGYVPGDNGRGDVQAKRGAPSNREQRIRYPYEITIKSGDVETVREADIELAQIKGAWKVVRVGLKTR